MRRALGVLGILWWSVRQSWYESRWNPWGMGSPGAAHRSTEHVMQLLEQQGPALLRTLQGTDGTPSSAPNPPVQ